MNKAGKLMEKIELNSAGGIVIGKKKYILIEADDWDKLVGLINGDQWRCSKMKKDEIYVTNCEKCYQMTNHKNGKCLKCEAKRKQSKGGLSK